jgi:hypothetical protein
MRGKAARAVRRQIARQSKESDPIQLGRITLDT